MPDNEMLAQEEPIIKTVVRNDTLMQVATTTTIGLTGGRMKCDPEQADFCITINSAWLNLADGKFSDPETQMRNIGDILYDYPEHAAAFTAFKDLVILLMRGALPPKPPIEEVVE